MAMNVNSTLIAYSNYTNDYSKAKTTEKKDAAKTVGNSSTQKEPIASVGEKSLSGSAQRVLKDLRASRADMDFLLQISRMEIMRRKF